VSWSGRVHENQEFALIITKSMSPYGAHCADGRVLTHRLDLAPGPHPHWRAMSSPEFSQGADRNPRLSSQFVLRKLPHVTVLFWALKTVAVTLGETSGDLFGIDLKFGYAPTAIAFLLFFLVVVVAQVRARRHHPALFWAVVLSTSMVGTEISDFMNRGFGHASDDSGGIGYTAGGAILITMLAMVFLVWWRSGQTYDVENIATHKGEILYWIAILISNTLGTSSGDVLAHDTSLGFRGAFFVLSGIMVLLIGAHYLTSINGTLLFWIAFVLTRPLGAAGGDYLVKPVDENGLGWGTLWGSVALFALLAVLVGVQIAQLQRHPLAPLPAPRNRTTGQPERPNGALVSATSAR
jgi:uncharacterized membrane-anchored protein